MIVLPVDHDDEYRIKLEKEELLRMLGVGMDPQEFRRLNIQAIRVDDHARQDRVNARRTELFKEGVGMNMLALLRTIVLQNELVLYAFKRLEENLSARPKSFNPSDWK